MEPTIETSDAAVLANMLSKALFTIDRLQGINEKLQQENADLKAQQATPGE